MNVGGGTGVELQKDVISLERRYHGGGDRARLVYLTFKQCAQNLSEFPPNAPKCHSKSQNVARTELSDDGKFPSTQVPSTLLLQAAHLEQVQFRTSLFQACFEITHLHSSQPRVLRTVQG